MSRKVGIKADYANRLLIIGELITGDLEGLIAFLGDGFFVVTEEAAGELTKRGVEFAEVEIVPGRPKGYVKGGKRNERSPNQKVIK